MKRLFTTVIWVLGLMPFFAQAQNVWLGPKLGVQGSGFIFASQADKDAYDERLWWGYQVGMVANYEASKHFSLHTEYNYSRKSRAYRVTTTDEIVELYRASYGFFDVSMLLRAQFGELPRHFYFNAGPVLGLWLGGSGRIETGLTGEAGLENGYRYNIRFKSSRQEPNEHMYVRDANRWQVGLEFGGGMVFDVFYGNKLMIDLRYQVGQTYYGDADSGDFGFPGLRYQDNFRGVSHTLCLSTAFLFSYELSGGPRKGR